ncbi:MAG: hypothetical protein HFG45_06335 [Oscillospiraceae bacterium]|jgi:hypothetical protein|nr:hypothetical protein [Oscillospiraceae bacterium]
MPVQERKQITMVKDAAGNTLILYPVTKAACVDGLEEAIQAALSSGSGGPMTWAKLEGE